MFLFGHCCSSGSVSGPRDNDHPDTTLAIQKVDETITKGCLRQKIAAVYNILSFRKRSLTLQPQYSAREEGNISHGNQNTETSQKFISQTNDRRDFRRDVWCGDVIISDQNPMVGRCATGGSGRARCPVSSFNGHVDQSETASTSQIATLARVAGADHSALVDMAWSQHLTDYQADRIASRALNAAIEDAEEEVSDDHYAAALVLLIGMGWAARERKQQADIADDQDIWIGAARAEARREGGCL